MRQQTTARMKTSSAVDPEGSIRMDRRRRVVDILETMSVESRNPSSGELIETFEETAPEALGALADRAHVAFASWRKRPLTERAAVLRETARRLRERKAEHARTMALEMGKPVVEGEAEAEKCALVCDWYADNGAAILEPQPRATDAKESFVCFEPLGVVLAIMPWNFPFWQVFRFAAPALIAGNGAILKHAPNVSRCALEIEAVLRAAGLPEDVFTTVLGGPEHASVLLRHPRVAAVTLTGSERAGRSVGEQAGRELKKSVLELGGSDPFIVLEDADVERAAEVAVSARLINSGQSCIAAKRFIVVESVADRFLERMVSEMAKRKIGDPLARETQVGPQARIDLRDNLHRQVQESVARGAKIEIGGAVPVGAGAFYPPTLLSAVAAGMPAFDEETFGPVASVIRAKDESDAVAMANATEFGLGAALWTADRERAKRVAAEIEAGCVFVNGMVKSDPRLPFGGVKKSGYGRELAEFGLREFTNIKSVWIA
jgi:succinate-semialdehyde dehydrogenase / glutarate-semialdehyde dehydrogenase